MIGSPTNIGGYRIVEPLGRGGMGVVYRAVHEESGQVVALKTVSVPRQELLQGIRREIHVLGRIRHPGIVRILDEGLQDGVPWYAMELLEGTSLRQWCRARATADLRTASGPAEGPDDAATGATLSAWWTTVLERGPQLRTESGGAETVPQGEATDRLSRGRRRAGAADEAHFPLVGDKLATVLTLIRRLCRPLAFLHGEGIVHRDLKPENIFIRPDGVPVLVDFGLMTQFGGEISREALEIAGLAVGTTAYMAPEQFRGQLVDARADLYALGCILYELVAGRPPFVGASASEVRRAHLRNEPPRLSELVRDGTSDWRVPAELDELALSLLAKRPQARLGYADDVAARLDALGAQDGLAAGPRPHAYLYRPGLAGREEAVRELEEQLSAAETSVGNLVLVGGESGVGKTRLVMEAARAARLRRFQVLTGECLPAAGADALRGLRPALQAFADRCRERGLAETERLLGRHGKLLALYEPALAGLPGQDAYSDPAELPPEAARMRLFTGLAETFEALAESGTVLLVLDDLQWADELTLGFLEFLVRSERIGHRALLVLGTYRSEESSGALQKVLGASGVRHLPLGRLSKRAVGSMVGDMLALQHPPEPFVSFLAQHSEGNPFFVAEYLRTAVGEELLYRNEAGRWQVALEEATEADYEKLPLPRSLRALVSRRLDTLSKGAHRLVDVAAVLGREFEESLLAGVAEVDRLELIDGVQELAARQVMEPLESGRLRFVHDKIREVTYERIGQEQRKRLHRGAAEAMEAASGAQESSLAVLGHHWEEAGETAGAQRCYLGAARQTRTRYAFAEAEQLYRRYLKLTERPTPESQEVRNELAWDVLFLQGHVQMALTECEVALEESIAIGDRASLARKLGTLGVVAWKAGQIERASAVSEQALAMARETGQRAMEPRVSINLGNIYLEQGRNDEAQSLYAQAIAISQELGDVPIEITALANLASAYEQRGRVEAILPLMERALAKDREIGNRRHEGLVLANLARHYQSQGNVDQVWELCQQSLAISREVGERRVEANALLTLAELNLDQGRPEVARKHCGEALAIHRQFGNRQGEGMGLRLSGRLATRGGAFDDAELLFDQALSLFQQLNDPYEIVWTTAWQGHLALARGTSASAFVERARDIATRYQFGARSMVGLALATLERAEAAFEAGEHHRLIWGELIDDLSARSAAMAARPGELPAAG